MKAISRNILRRLSSPGPSRTAVAPTPRTRTVPLSLFLNTAQDLLRCLPRAWLAARAPVRSAGRSRSGTSARAAPEKAKRVRGKKRRNKKRAKLSRSGHVVTKKTGILTGSCSRLCYRLREPKRPLRKKTHQRSRVSLHSRCVWFVVVGLTAVSQSETEAAALQQAKKQQRSGGGGGKITRLCPPVWLAENTERNKNN